MVVITAVVDNGGDGDGGDDGGGDRMHGRKERRQWRNEMKVGRNAR